MTLTHSLQQAATAAGHTDPLIIRVYTGERWGYLEYYWAAAYQGLKLHG